VDVVRSVREMLKSSCPDLKCLPTDVARLEEHLAHPPRLHNIRKQRQVNATAHSFFAFVRLKFQQLGKIKTIFCLKDYAKKIGSTGDVDLPHIFAEGPSMSLADLILLPCFYVLLRPFCPDVLTKVIPLVSEWMRRVQDTDAAKRASHILEMVSKSRFFRSCRPSAKI